MRITRELMASYFVICILLFAILLLLEKELLTGALLILCVLTVGYREIWNLARIRRFPPFDERVQNNIAMSVRNTYPILLLATSAIIVLLPSSERGSLGTIGNITLSVCVAYVLSYIYYDRIQQKVSLRIIRIGQIFLKILVIAMAILVLVALVSWIYNSIVGASIFFFT